MGGWMVRERKPGKAASWVRLSGFALALACAPIPAPAQSPPADASGYFYVADRVADHVHLLHQADPHSYFCGNVAVIEQSSSIVLFDSGCSFGGGERVVAAVRRISSKPVSAIVLSHWHYDHM